MYAINFSHCHTLLVWRKFIARASFPRWSFVWCILLAPLDTLMLNLLGLMTLRSWSLLYSWFSVLWANHFMPLCHIKVIFTATFLLISGIIVVVVEKLLHEVSLTRKWSPVMIRAGETQGEASHDDTLDCNSKSRLQPVASNKMWPNILKLQLNHISTIIISSDYLYMFRKKMHSKGSSYWDWKAQPNL